MKFFVDHCISPKLVPILDIAAQRSGHSICRLTDRFDCRVEDTEWMLELGREGGWAAITKNPRIVRVAQERAAWLESRLTTFFLDGPGWGNLYIEDTAWRMIRWWPRIMEHAARAKPGTGFIIPGNFTGRFRTVAVKRKEMVYGEMGVTA